jgi:hypothetical protein
MSRPQRRILTRDLAVWQDRFSRGLLTFASRNGRRSFAPPNSWFSLFANNTQFPMFVVTLARLSQ